MFMRYLIMTQRTINDPLDPLGELLVIQWQSSLFVCGGRGHVSVTGLLFRGRRLAMFHKGHHVVWGGRRVDTAGIGRVASAAE